MKPLTIILLVLASCYNTPSPVSMPRTTSCQHLSRYNYGGLEDLIPLLGDKHDDQVCYAYYTGVHQGRYDAIRYRREWLNNRTATYIGCMDVGEFGNEKDYTLRFRLLKAFQLGCYEGERNWQRYD